MLIHKVPKDFCTEMYFMCFCLVEIPNLTEEVFEWPKYLSDTGTSAVKTEFFKHVSISVFTTNVYKQLQ